METPKAPDFTKEVNVELLYKALCRLVEGETERQLLYAIYEKATNLETKRNELEGKLALKEKDIEGYQKVLDRWESGEKNILSNQFTEGQRNNLLDVFYIMLEEYDADINHRQSAKDRLNTRLPIHENACRAIAVFMDDLMGVVMDKLVPDRDKVHLDTNKLSEEEKKKIEGLWVSDREERVKISRDAITLNSADLHLEGNQVLIDPKNMDPRERKAIMKRLDPDQGSESSVALPVRVLVQSGEAVDEQNIRAINSFPEENPDKDVEEADQEMYGEDSSTDGEDNPDDKLPF